MDVERTFFFTGNVVLYHSGRFFNERQVRRGLKEEDPEPLTQLLTEDARWYNDYFLPVSKMIFQLLVTVNKETCCSLIF